MRLRFPLVSAVALLFAACDGCGEGPAVPPPPGCVLDVDCDPGQVCRAGACVPDDGPPPEQDAGPEPGDDAGTNVGVLTVLPEARVEFGAVRLGTAVDRNITLKNTGNARLRVLQIVVDDPQGVFFAEPTGFLDLPLDPDGELGVALTHVPNDGIPDSATLKVLHSGEGGLLNIELFAEFKGTPVLSVTTEVRETAPDVTVIDLGDVPTGSSRSTRLYLRNIGSLDSALAVSGAVVTPAAGPFSVVAPSLNPPVFLSSYNAECASSATCPASAPDCVSGLCLDAAGVPPDTLPLTVTFSPSASGDATATLTLTTTDGGSPVQRDVTLRARGVTGLLVATPPAVNFPDAYVGRTQRQSVNISNQGSAAITIERFEFIPSANNPFRLEHPLPVLPYTVAPSESFNVDVVFSPLAAGQFARTLALRTDGEQDTTIEVTATARVPPSIRVLDEVTRLDLPPEGVRFFDVYTGFSAEQRLRIINQGPAGSVLHVQRIAIDGPQAARFTVAPGSLDNTPLPGAINLEPHAELTVTYLPGPLTGFNDTASLILESDDPDSPAVVVPLSGRSVQPIIEVSDTTIDFGPVLVGTSPSPFRDVTIRNGGFGPLVITQITQPTRTEFALSGAQSTTLEFGQTTTFRVTFTPTQAQSVSATMQIQSSDRTRPTVAIALGGGGSDCPPRANASVQVVGNQCVYTCSNGFHACGDVCASNSSPDSCGSSCTPCVSRANTQRGCNAGSSTCTYTCSTTFFDLNNDRGVPQGTGSDGCEYQCPFANPSAEVCDNLDNNCNGKIDDGLPLEPSEPPNSCSNSAQDLGDVPDNNVALQFTGFKLYDQQRNGGDEDWFKFRAHETEFNFCFGSEPYLTTIELLDIPAGRDYDLEVRDNSCNGQRFFSTRGGNQNEILQLRWDGSCGSDDNLTFFVRVFPFPTSPPHDSCFAYRLRITHDRL